MWYLIGLGIIVYAIGAFLYGFFVDAPAESKEKERKKQMRRNRTHQPPKVDTTTPMKRVPMKSVNKMEQEYKELLTVIGEDVERNKDKHIAQISFSDIEKYDIEFFWEEFKNYLVAIEASNHLEAIQGRFKVDELVFYKKKLIELEDAKSFQMQKIKRKMQKQLEQLKNE